MVAMSTWVLVSLTCITIGLVTVAIGLWWLYRSLTRAATAAAYSMRWGDA